MTYIVSLKDTAGVFEVIAVKGKVSGFRAGTVSLNEALAANEIFSNAKEGHRASQEALQTAFGTTNINDSDVLSKILMEGRFSPSTAELKLMRETVYQQMKEYICGNFNIATTHQACDAATLDRHVANIKGFKVDEHKDAITQANALMKKLEAVLPLEKCQAIRARVGCPMDYVATLQPAIVKFAKPEREVWTERAWVFEVEIGQREYEQVAALVQNCTSGKGRLAILDGSGMVAEANPDNAGAKVFKKKTRKSKRAGHGH